MRQIVLIMIIATITGCSGGVPIKDAPLYTIADRQSVSAVAESEGWCDLPLPTEKGSLYYTREDGQCVAKVM